MTTFPVDDVVPATDALPTRPIRDLFPEALAIGGDPDLPIVEPDGVHPLLSAVARAFAEHRPLVLSPDAVWLTIAGGIAQHVRLNAEELRPLLVEHSGRKRLSAVVGGPMPTDVQSWQDLAETFGKMLAAETSNADVFECDFSTSTEVERTAGRIVMLDAYSPYFAVWLMCVCGIPSITLTGTVGDWRKIRRRIDAISGFGLEKWCRSLGPIIEQFVRAAAGEVDAEFWRRIYKPKEVYGGEVVTGWITRFYPYLKNDDAQDLPNWMLDRPIHALSEDGISTSQVPATLSRAVINVNDRVGGDNRVVALHGGLIGVTQTGDGALRPIAGWHLVPAQVEMDDVIDRMRKDHETRPAVPVRVLTGPADVMALYARVGEAFLFQRTWHILPADPNRRVRRGAGRRWLLPVIELADGRSICAAIDERSPATYWAAGSLLEENPSDIKVYGTSLALLLDGAMDAAGDIEHMVTGTLAEIESLPAV